MNNENGTEGVLLAEIFLPCYLGFNIMFVVYTRLIFILFMFLDYDIL